MANEYSIAIHHYLSDKISLAKKAQKKAEKENNPEIARYYEGRLQELNIIRRYMNDNIDLKTQKYY